MFKLIVDQPEYLQDISVLSNFVVHANFAGNVSIIGTPRINFINFTHATGTEAHHKT